MLKTSLFEYSDGYIVFKRTISVTKKRKKIKKK